MAHLVLWIEFPSNQIGVKYIFNKEKCYVQSWMHNLKVTNLTCRATSIKQNGAFHSKQLNYFIATSMFLGFWISRFHPPARFPSLNLDCGSSTLPWFHPLAMNMYSFYLFSPSRWTGALFSPVHFISYILNPSISSIHPPLDFFHR